MASHFADRAQQLADNIRRELGLLRQYEAILSEEDDPRRVLKYRRVIGEIQTRISDYSKQRDDLNLSDGLSTSELALVSTSLQFKNPKLRI